MTISLHPGLKNRGFFYFTLMKVKNPITTITGIVLAVVSVLTLTGVITPEQQTGLESNLAGIVTAVGAIVALFSGDPGKENAGV